MSTPLISVILPIRNGDHLLIKAVDSIVQQTLSDWELIIIDDGNNERVLPQLPTDSRISVVVNPTPGLVNALNFGANIASAPLLARMDGDDIALPERLARQWALMNTNPELGITGTQVEMFSYHQTLGEGYRRYQQWINSVVTTEQIAQQIFIESPIPHPSAMIRRDVFEYLGGYRDLDWPEDYDLWLRAYAQGIKMAKPQGILLRWCDWPQRTSRIDPRYQQKRFIRAKAHFLAKTLLHQRSCVIWGAAPTGALLYDCLNNEGIEVQAFIDVDRKKNWRPQAGQTCSLANSNQPVSPRADDLISGWRTRRTRTDPCCTNRLRKNGNDRLLHGGLALQPLLTLDARGLEYYLQLSLTIQAPVVSHPTVGCRRDTPFRWLDSRFETTPPTRS